MGNRERASGQQTAVWLHHEMMGPDHVLSATPDEMREIRAEFKW